MRAPGFAAAAWLARWRSRVAPIARKAPAALLALVCLAPPLASFMAGGRGRLAFPMYSATVSYRLELAWWDDAGLRHPLAPTAVARDVSFDSAAPFLAGAEVYRTVPQIDALRAHLGDVAKAACRGRAASAIEATLFERSSPVPSAIPSAVAGIEPATTAVLRASERVPCPRHE